MSRKKRDYKREITPDPKYGDILLARVINVIMKSGKKGVAEMSLYAALEKVAEKGKDEPTEIMRRTISNIKPMVEVRSRRVGGANYQVPTEVNPDRAQSMAIRWLTTAADQRSERSLAERLAGEIMDALSGKGGAMKKREETHKMAEANKAFAHFRW